MGRHTVITGWLKHGFMAVRHRAMRINHETARVLVVECARIGGANRDPEIFDSRSSSP